MGVSRLLARLYAVIPRRCLRSFVDVLRDTLTGHTPTVGDDASTGCNEDRLLDGIYPAFSPLLVGDREKVEDDEQTSRSERSVAILIALSVKWSCLGISCESMGDEFVERLSQASSVLTFINALRPQGKYSRSQNCSSSETCRNSPASDGVNVSPDSSLE